ncbi:MAG TPA: C39 family peptidase [Verrucomicrobiae bacterium]
MRHFRCIPALLLSTCLAGAAFDPRGAQFIGLHHFSSFQKSRGARSLETVLTSRVFVTRINWDQLVASWNAEMPSSTYLKVEARAIYPAGATKYYTLGLWSPDPSLHPRESVPGQKDEYGDVATDTLILQRPANRLQLRLTLGSDDNRKAVLKFLGLSLKDTHAEPHALPADRAAWDSLLYVPERSQMNYPDGKVLCSPTTVSMIMGYWARKLTRPDLDRDVPQIVDAIYDAKWKGTGNWPFNTAYAGSFHGLRAYVTRMTDLSELEEWIAAGVPVGLSVCYDRLRGKGPGPNGHLVVCVGFTADGDPIINDPGTSQNVRKVFPRKNLIHAWAYSHNAAYLIYPQNYEVPKDRFGHWDSWTARQRVNLQ